MENITIEKSFRFDEVIDSIEMINIDDQLRCEILDDDTHAVKTINVTGLLNTTLGQKDFKEDVITNYGKNILVIKNGSAYVSEADCPDKICTAHRAISKTGESIVCLPHKLVLTIESE